MALAAEQPAILSFLSSCQVGNHFPKSGVKIHHWKPPPKFWFSWEVKSHCFQSFVSLTLFLGRTNGFLRCDVVASNILNHEWPTFDTAEHLMIADKLYKKTPMLYRLWGNYHKSTSVDFVGTFLEVLSTAVEPTTFCGWVFRWLSWHALFFQLQPEGRQG